ncbi:MAG: lysostaphin resistance A-like protein [Planctomycetota bacterium]
MTRLRPARFPWTGANVLFCSAIVAGTYLALKLWSPLGKLGSAGAALAGTGLLAVAFILPATLVLVVGALRRQRNTEAGERAPDAVSYSPRELWLTRGGLARDVIAGMVLGLLLAFMNGVSIQRGIADYSPRTAGALSALVWRSKSLPDVSMLLVALGVIAPVAEEVFFRGVLYAGLRKQLPVVPAVVLSSAAFAAAHMDSMRLLAFVLGVVAALLIEFTGSLVPAILAHMGVNIGFVLFLANGGLLAKEVPTWAVWAACGVTNVLFFVLGQPLFGKTGADESSDVAVASEGAEAPTPTTTRARDGASSGDGRAS